MTPLMAIGIGLILIGAVLVFDWRQRRREARRKADVAFLARALEVSQRHRRRRPKVDSRIQRRRYGQS